MLLVAICVVASIPSVQDQVFGTFMSFAHPGVLLHDAATVFIFNDWAIQDLRDAGIAALIACRCTVAIAWLVMLRDTTLQCTGLSRS